MAGWAVAKGGVYGFSESGSGLVGACQVFNGGVPLHLNPGGVPSTGAHTIGNIAMDASGLPNVCMVSGTPGTFVPLQPGGANNAIYAALSAFLLFLCFLVVAAQLTLVMIESYIVLGAGVLFLGFSAFRGTASFGENLIAYAFHDGIKVFF